MERKGNYLALDFGAESGRAIVVTLDRGRASLEEIHRFPNKPSFMNGTLYWDLPFLFREVMTSLKKAAGMGIELDSIAVDTWGVDFGLLDKHDELISNPVHYRDERTASVKEDSPMNDEEIFVETGGLPWNIGSLFQLKALMERNSDQMEGTSTFLNMPDLFNFLLCGEKRSEITIASTSLMVDSSGNWSDKIIENFRVPRILPPIVHPGEILSDIRPDLTDRTGYSDLKVITTCSHDTASVAAVVPERSENSVFLSSGTWSILGKINDEPLTDPALMEAGFTNEASLDSWYLCRNITGLYPFQELKREWELSMDPWDYGKMCLEAEKAESAGFVNLEHNDFQTPGHMKEKIARHLGKEGGPSSMTRGEAAKVLLDSLALEYALNLRKLESLTGHSIDKLYILGGGIKNTYLCQKTADLCGIKVVAGIDQGTALGNGLVQAYGLGHIATPDEIRKIASDSFEMVTYDPVIDEENEKNILRYRELKEKLDENE